MGRGRAGSPRRSVPEGDAKSFPKTAFLPELKRNTMRRQRSRGPRSQQSTGTQRLVRSRSLSANGTRQKRNRNAGQSLCPVRPPARWLALPFPVMTIITGNDCSVGSASAPAAIGGWKPPYRVSPRSSMRADCHMLLPRQKCFLFAIDFLARRKTFPLFLWRAARGDGTAATDGQPTRTDSRLFLIDQWTRGHVDFKCGDGEGTLLDGGAGVTFFVIVLNRETDAEDRRYRLEEIGSAMFCKLWQYRMDSVSVICTYAV